MVNKNRRYEKQELDVLTANQLDRLSVIFEELCVKKIIEQSQIDAIFASLEKSRDAAKGVAMGMPVIQGHTPLFPVIPKNILDLSIQMQLVGYGGKAGRCEKIDLREVEDLGRIFTECYWIISVENGKSFLGTAPNEAEIFIKGLNRRCLTVAEVIALNIHTNVLSQHFVNAVRSRYQDMVISLYLDADGPVLECVDINDANNQLGTPSCLYRV